MSELSERFWIVVRDGFIPDRTFDDLAAADRYARHCNANYQGSFAVRACSERALSRIHRITAGERLES